MKHHPATKYEQTIKTNILITASLAFSNIGMVLMQPILPWSIGTLVVVGGIMVAAGIAIMAMNVHLASKNMREGYYDEYMDALANLHEQTYRAQTLQEELNKTRHAKDKTQNPDQPQA